MEENFAPQMGSQSSSYVIRYGLGARGIDYVEKTQGGNATKTYPLYDGHGNMIATISPSGTISNQRAYDAWGGVRAESGVDAVNPNGRYCANLGHKQDDESGLIYMRARYCDPATGRFVNQDRAMNGANWFVYCGNDPVNRVDADGQRDVWVYGATAFGLIVSLLALYESYQYSKPSRPMILSGLIFLAAWMGTDKLRTQPYGSDDRYGSFIVSSATFMTLFTLLTYSWFPPKPSSILTEVLGVM